MANLMSILLALDLFFFFFRSNANLTDVDFLIEEVNEKKKLNLHSTRVTLALKVDFSIIFFE